ncbi:MAG TPA: hypothetical protein DCQ64_18745 [Candidatus Rokubacteria bacterium]|nr:hypothetical protein [Candidatus Rokubacteria bacterium]
MRIAFSSQATSSSSIATRASVMFKPFQARNWRVLVFGGLGGRGGGMLESSLAPEGARERMVPEETSGRREAPAAVETRRGSTGPHHRHPAPPKALGQPAPPYTLGTIPARAFVATPSSRM